MAVFSFVKLGKKIFGKQKTTGKTTNPFQRKKMRSDYSAKIGQLKVDLAKLRGGSKKLQTSIDEVRATMREKARVKKMGGGFAGRRMGYSKGSKPDFLDLDKDGNTSESMKSAAKQAKRK